MLISPVGHAKSVLVVSSCYKICMLQMCFWISHEMGKITWPFELYNSCLVSWRQSTYKVWCLQLCSVAVFSVSSCNAFTRAIYNHPLKLLTNIVAYVLCTQYIYIFSSFAKTESILHLSGPFYFAFANGFSHKENPNRFRQLLWGTQLPGDRMKRCRKVI